ncbi:MAG: choice-of-anchor D domain-containing protein [Myxococcota bacterium]
MFLALSLGGALLYGCDDGNNLTTVLPKLVVDPDSGAEIKFDDVVLTRTKAGDRVIVVKNEGDGVLLLDTPTLAGSSFFEIIDSPKTVAVGASANMLLRFHPLAPGNATATLTLGSNDPKRRTVSWTLSGVAKEPCILFADQSHMVFTVGEVKTVNLKALTTSGCTVERISNDSDVFPLKDAPALPITIAGGQSVAINIEHKAVSARERGVPIRELTFFEREGAEVTVLLEGEAPLFSCLSVEPTEIFLPETEVGQSRHVSATVYNRCGKAATVVSAAIGRGWRAYTLDAQTYPMSVPARGQVTIGVTFTPYDPSDTRGHVAINTNDSAAPQMGVDISGVVALPESTYFPDNLDFGSVVYRDLTNMNLRSECGSNTRTVQIYSSGSAPLRIDQLEIDAAGDKFFEVTSVTVDAAPVRNFNQPFTIPVGASAEITLQFYPGRLTPAAHSSRLLIHSNVPGDPAVVTLKGNAVADGPGHDTFTQSAGPKVDILWIIDSSCSMYDEQIRLIDNLSRFVAYADSQHADYQMAVTDTDGLSTESGKFRLCYPHPRIVRYDYPDREAAFRCLFEVGTNGPGVEAGWAAAHHALQRAQAGAAIPLNVNAGFLRDDATLAVVAMSDEEDQSAESNELLRDYFWSVKGKTRVKMHAIAGPTHGPCTIAPNTQPGRRYEWMANATGGMFFSICEPDWSPMLEALGLSTFVPLSEWTLSQAAVPASVVVTVNGLPVVWDVNNGFTYDASDNAVRFHGTSVPRPGEQINVDYVSNCRP